MILFGKGAMGTTVSGGRKLVDTWKPSTGANKTFAGDNRPELTNRGNGVWTVDVEKASTNLLTAPNDFTNAAWVKTIQGTGILPVVTSNFGIAPDGTLTADRLQCDLGGGVTTNDRSWIAETFSTAKTLPNISSVWAKLNTGVSSEMYFTINGGSIKTSVTNEWARVDYLRTDINADDIRIGLIGGIGLPDTIDVLLWRGKMANSNYLTNWNEGTRPAPSPVITDALNATGVIYGRVDMVRDDSVIQTIFDSGGTAGTHQSLFTLNASNQFVAQIFGSTGGVLT